ncbi:MAG: NAD-dependent epimerase/dehydratase family protein [Phycisphaerae bacterium]
MIKDRSIFITGGAGFIGSTVIGRLIEHNRITVYDSFRRDSIHGKAYASHPNLRLVEGDVLDAAGLASQMAGANIVLHCAAIAGIDTVCRQPTATMRVNMLGTANALEAARQLPELERFVDFSTSEVFGQSAFRSEETDSTSIGPVGEARWTYAVSKLAGEFLAKAYHQEFGMPTVTVRPFNVYGPGQVGEGAMKVFITQALRDADITIHNEGNQIRAWCYIDDFVDGLLLTMSQPGAVGESFNIGNPRAVITVYGLAQTVVRVLKSSSRIVFAAGHHTDVELRVPSVAKAAELLGFQAKVDLDEGILATAEFFRKAAE